jgi:hypothetical protein
MADLATLIRQLQGAIAGQSVRTGTVDITLPAGRSVQAVDTGITGFFQAGGIGADGTVIEGCGPNTVQVNSPWIQTMTFQWIAVGVPDGS